MKVVGCQPYAAATFTPQDYTGTHFLEADFDPSAHGTVRWHGKNPRRHRESIPRPID